jgi:hypothetical protein
MRRLGWRLAVVEVEVLLTFSGGRARLACWPRRRYCSFLRNPLLFDPLADRPVPSQPAPPSRLLSQNSPGSNGQASKAPRRRGRRRCREEGRWSRRRPRRRSRGQPDGRPAEGARRRPARQPRPGRRGRRGRERQRLWWRELGAQCVQRSRSKAEVMPLVPHATRPD